jgi:hypothetical protein
MKANLLAFRLMSFVLLALIWKEFPLWLYPQLKDRLCMDGIVTAKTPGVLARVGLAMTTPPKLSAR